jgi:hypothetical protein
MCFTFVSIFAAQVIDSELRIVPQFWAPSLPGSSKNKDCSRELHTPGYLFGIVVSQLLHRM